MTAMDDALVARAIRERREAIEERDRLRAALGTASDTIDRQGWVIDGLLEAARALVREPVSSPGFPPLRQALLDALDRTEPKA